MSMSLLHMMMIVMMMRRSCCTIWSVTIPTVIPTIVVHTTSNIININIVNIIVLSSSGSSMRSVGDG